MLIEGQFGDGLEKVEDLFFAQELPELTESAIEGFQFQFMLVLMEAKDPVQQIIGQQF